MLWWSIVTERYFLVASLRAKPFLGLAAAEPAEEVMAGTGRPISSLLPLLSSAIASRTGVVVVVGAGPAEGDVTTEEAAGVGVGVVGEGVERPGTTTGLERAGMDVEKVEEEDEEELMEIPGMAEEAGDAAVDPAKDRGEKGESGVSGASPWAFIGVELGVTEGVRGKGRGEREVAELVGEEPSAAELAGAGDACTFVAPAAGACSSPLVVAAESARWRL
jgi:hypothetical protein